MHQIITDITRPDPALLDEFNGIPVSIISDVTGNAGVTMDHGIKPVYRGASMAGSAVTVKAAPSDNLIIHKAITMAQPGDVLVVDGDGYLEAAFIGELMAETCQVHDHAGIIIDGAVRDRDGIEALGFPVYARGIHPKGPYKNDPGSINVPISCGGVAVDPGDIVVGDDDGVCIVPHSDAETILGAAREKLRAEEEAREWIQAGEYPFEKAGYDTKLASHDIHTQ